MLPALNTSCANGETHQNHLQQNCTTTTLIKLRRLGRLLFLKHFTVCRLPVPLLPGNLTGGSWPPQEKQLGILLTHAVKYLQRFCPLLLPLTQARCEWSHLENAARRIFNNCSCQLVVPKGHLRQRRNACVLFASCCVAPRGLLLTWGRGERTKGLKAADVCVRGSENAGSALIRGRKHCWPS